MIVPEYDIIGPDEGLFTPCGPIGCEIRRIRRISGLTQEELSERSGVSRGRIDAIENGRSDNMRFVTIVSLLDALGHDLRIERRPDGEDA